MKQVTLNPIDTQIPDNLINDKSQDPDIIIQNKTIDCVDKSVHTIQLQEAIIWSEILGKPVCKRRKRSYYGY